MAHYSPSIETRKSTPTEWLRIGAQIGQIVNNWSYRDDLVVYLGEEMSAPYAALFNPASAEVEVNVVRAFGSFANPALIGDLTKRKNQLEHASGCGSVYHEACHARFTRWSLVDAARVLNKREYDALMLLEEGRIESFGVDSIPGNKVLLRSSGMEIAIGDFDKVKESLTSIDSVVQLCGLMLARVDAGVFTEEDVEPLAEVVDLAIGADNVAKLRSIWIAFQAHDQHTNALPLYDLAREWVKIVDEIKSEQGEEPNDGGCSYPGASSEPGAPGELGEPSESGEPSENPIWKAVNKALEDAIEEIKDNIQIDNQTVIDNAIEDEEMREEVQARNSEAERRQEEKKVSDEVFGRGTGPSADTKTHSRLIESRKPTGSERASAVRVARLLDKAKYREREQTRIKSVVPPGRLRTRAIVQGQALKSKGVNQETEAWRRTQRKHTEDPTLHVGVLVDISGSMRSAMNPMATTAWVLSEAGRRIQAQTSMVYFGNGVFPTLKPGQHLDEVKVYSATDNTERFEKAFKALNGQMNLTRSSGARLLVIVSDGYYDYDQREAASKAVAECDKAGVAVIWLTYDEGSTAKAILQNTKNARLILANGKTSEEVAQLIGSESADALTKVGRR
jgi:hypothetical protein